MHPVVTDLANHLRAAESLRSAYLETGDPVTLRLALEVSKLAIESALPDERMGRAIALGIRCMLLRMAHERDKDPAKLAEAIQAGRVAIDIFPPNDPGYPQALNSLGNALQEEFGRTRDAAALSEALGMYREALRMLPAGHPDVPGMLSSIGTVLMTQGMQSEDSALLDEAVQAGRDAVAASVPGSPAHATRLASLGRALIARFAHRGWPSNCSARRWTACPRPTRCAPSSRITWPASPPCAALHSRWRVLLAPRNNPGRGPGVGYSTGMGAAIVIRADS